MRHFYSSQMLKILDELFFKEQFQKLISTEYSSYLSAHWKKGIQSYIIEFLNFQSSSMVNHTGFYTPDILQLIFLTAQCCNLSTRILVRQFFSTATFELFWHPHGPFTAPHGPKFSTAPSNFLRPLLSKGAVATATLQPWFSCTWYAP
jgi:hypothetical protein